MKTSKHYLPGLFLGSLLCSVFPNLVQAQVTGKITGSIIEMTVRRVPTYFIPGDTAETFTQVAVTNTTNRNQTFMFRVMFTNAADGKSLGSSPSPYVFYPAPNNGAPTFSDHPVSFSLKDVTTVDGAVTVMTDNGIYLVRETRRFTP